MACGKNEECLNIANNIYPNLQSEINSSINTITSSVNEIISGLSSLTIPDDYLGTKVKSRIITICSNLSSDIGEISSINGSINSFVSEKIKEHQKHYEEWKKEQERILEKKRRAKLENQKQEKDNLLKNKEITK